ncbi:uncharacterized protein LOC132748343 [Ruditapes philippinarum]|uniref:uncharacterized protein LOC132748343 n=1 Tax=Ruditapes philippinarum TaxID=129788 RepID=UPI00295B32FE|nr:uncharacterized protein LOC132748343 [Ruditapes philippinarum]
MANLNITTIVIVLVTIYIVNVMSQSTTNKQTTVLPTTQVVANQESVNEPTVTGTDPANTHVEKQPQKRSQVKRRKFKRRLRKKRPSTKNNTEVIAPDPASEAEQTLQTLVIEPKEAPVVKTVMAAQVKVAAKNKPLKIAQKQPRVQPDNRANAVVAKPEKNSAGFGQEMFFDMFSDNDTTTIQPEAAGPPPNFNVNKVPPTKVVPTVDTKNAKAYDGSLCSDNYKPHDTLKTKYLMKSADNSWGALDCAPNMGTGLVWRQDLCSCGEELVAVDPNDWCGSLGYSPHLGDKHKYIRKDQGVNVNKTCPATLVWSQDKCLCIYDPTVEARPIENTVTFVCKTILKMEFEGNLKDSAMGYQIQTVDIKRRGKLPRIRYRKVPGSTEKAAMIVSQPLKFLAFRGNDFQKQITYALSFKISPRHNNRDNFMVLLTDECRGSGGGQNKARKPSIRLAFQPNTKTFNFQFRTLDKEVDQNINKTTADMYGWYKVVVYLEYETLTMEVNGQKVFEQKDMLGKIPQNKCPLFIAGRGPAYDRTEDFYGYMDNVQLVKDCKFHEANIKFL